MNTSLNFGFFYINKYIYFLFLCLITIGISFLYRDLLISDSMYYVAYSEQLSYERITKKLESREKNEWLIFVFIPLLYLIRFFAVAVCLQIGAVFYEYKISFGRLFQVAMFAEAVYLLPKIIKFVWFYFFVSHYGLEDLANFYPYSLLALFEPKSLEAWLQYPIFLINLFEVLYWLALAKGLQFALQKSFSDSLAFVISTYGIGLLVWVIFIVFLQVMLS